MGLRDDKIFVQIPSYRDSQLVDTIESLLKNTAYNQKRLQISICWQHSDFEKIPGRIRRKNIQIIDIPYVESKGANWARSLIQKNWKGEPIRSWLTPIHDSRKIGILN